MKTRVVNSNTEAYDVYIGRPSKWSNPFIIGKDGNRKEVIQKYREWINSQSELLENLTELEGKRLGCHCVPLACHGNILVELLNNVITNELLLPQDKNE